MYFLKNSLKCVLHVTFNFSHDVKKKEEERSDISEINKGPHVCTYITCPVYREIFLRY